MIITIANNKGGVCKSTIAMHIATWLARAGKPTVLIDLDAQGSLARFLGLEPADDLAELFQAIINLRPDRRPPLQSFLTPVPGYPRLAVVRGWGGSVRLEATFQQSGVRPAESVLQEALAPLLKTASVQVILDTGPYAGVLHVAALTVADHVIVPGIPEAGTESGLLDIGRRLNALGRTITGVVPTKVIVGAVEHARTIKDWQDVLGPIVYVDSSTGLVGLPRRIIWGELVRHRQPIWDFAPNDVAAIEMTAIARRVAYDAAIRI